MISADTTGEPRLQVSDGAARRRCSVLTSMVGAPATAQTVDAKAFGYPIRSLADLPAGRYRAQAMINRYQTFRRSDGHTVKLPPDKWEGQQYARKPGNLFSRPVNVTISKTSVTSLALDQEIPPVADFATKETKYVKYLRIRSELLSKFWGTDMYLGAWVLLPEGFDSHPGARYPLVINHGHFPSGVDGFRETPPDPDLKPDYSERFSLAGYNRIQQELGYQFYKDWTGPGFPRVLLVADSARDAVLRRLVRGELGEQRTVRRRDHERARAGDRTTIPRHRRRLGAVHVRRIDGRVGSARGADVLP